MKINRRPVAKSGVKPPNRRPYESAEPAVLTVEETAAYLRISPHSAYIMSRNGLLPIVRPLKRRTLVIKKLLDEAIVDRTLGTRIFEPAAS
ncbi:MAG TPA: helix-turn-helix domain-containing protein [Candidatus Eremiobacteraceae bacterium]|nr:helix-turn-helix domain-containing protein [Candidatus Eremiobacteraceae bacterium]